MLYLIVIGLLGVLAAPTANAITSTAVAGAALSLAGELVEGGAECPRFRALDGRYYTLEGDLGGFHTGDVVEITGAIPGASHCMQDTTIRLETIRSVQPAGTGDATVSGRVIIGPLCPVEPCPGPRPDVYSSRMLLLQPTIGRTIAIKLNPDGTFRSKVRPGTYKVYVTNCVYLGCRYAVPRTVTIAPYQETSVRIDIDTGIR
jgi:hypothetical protein